MVNPLLKKYWSRMKKDSSLDLGSGDGMNVAFMRDKSIHFEWIEKNYGEDIEDYGWVGRHEWGNITCFYVLHFLQKPLTVVQLMKENTQKGGLNMITAFTKEVTWPKDKGFYFKKNELKEIYSDWKILHYEEKLTPTKSGSNQMTAYLVAKKP